MGLTVKVLTGDNDLVTRKVCSESAIHAEENPDRQPGGNDDRPEQLAEAVETHGCVCASFARAQKRIVQAASRKRGTSSFHG